MNPDKTTTLTANGKTYTIYYGMKALRSFEIEAGKPVTSMHTEGDNISMIDLAILIRAGLIQFQPTITMDEVDAICDDIGLSQAGQIFGEAVKKSFSKQIEVPYDNGEAARENDFLESKNTYSLP